MKRYGEQVDHTENDRTDSCSDRENERAAGEDHNVRRSVLESLERSMEKYDDIGAELTKR